MSNSNAEKNNIMVMEEPKEGFTTKAKVIRVIDGDTVEVEIKRTFPVRLIDPDNLDKHFNMPERGTYRGEMVTKFLRNLLTGYDVNLWIPAGKSSMKLTDINSFNRIIGAIWYRGQSVATQLQQYLTRITSK